MSTYEFIVDTQKKQRDAENAKDEGRLGQEIHRRNQDGALMNAATIAARVNSGHSPLPSSPPPPARSPARPQHQPALSYGSSVEVSTEAVDCPQCLIGEEEHYDDSEEDEKGLQMV